MNAVVAVSVRPLPAGVALYEHDGVYGGGSDGGDGGGGSGGGSDGGGGE